MTKTKGKSGIGGGTGKKGWNRWKAGANKAKTKPYVSKANKLAEAAKSNSNNKGDISE